jgi:phosphoribosylamine--glycine ligase
VITGVDEANALADTVVFQAGTKIEDGKLITAGGRVLAVTSISADLEDARAKAYEGVARIDFEGAQNRSDIAAGAPSIAS